MALLRVRSVEKLKGVVPAVLGRLLGLDRAPEVKTLRRKLAELGERELAATFLRNLAQRWAHLDEEVAGVLYVDGHVRVYHGKRELPKAHVAQLRLSVPATTDYWVNDQDGDPLFLVTAPANAGLVAMLPEVLREARQCVGDRRVTLVFDRGGYSPALFEKLAVDCEILTYAKGKLDPLPLEQFVERELRVDGAVARYKLAEKTLTFANGFSMRCVAVLRDDGKQTHILTTRKDWRDAYVAYRMFARWRQENYFRYMGEEFGLDALPTYATEPDDPARLVPNPERKKLAEERAAAKAETARLEREYGVALETNEEATRPTARGVKIANGQTGKALRAARAKEGELLARWRSLPAKVPIGSILSPQDIVKLEVERKLFTDVLRSAAYRAESSLLALLREHADFARDAEEGRSFLQQAMRLSGDLEARPDGTLCVSLEPMSAPRFTEALQQLCDFLNTTETCYPETSSRLVYRVRPA
jgi:prepilin-type processing-associated H-X9-DG protein